MRILVTGGAGFIGFSLSKYLNKKQYDVTAMVRDTNKAKKLLAIGVPVIEHDFYDKHKTAEIFSHYDSIIHCAGFASDWGRKQEFYHANVEVTKTILEASVKSNIKKLIHTSTTDIFGHQHKSIITETSPLSSRTGWYRQSKVSAEKLVRKYINQHMLDISIIYPPWVYGEGDMKFLPEIIKALKDHKCVYFRKNGSNALGLVYIENLCKAYEIILNSNSSKGEGFLIADEPIITAKQLFDEICRKLQLKNTSFLLPYFLSYGLSIASEVVFKCLGKKQRPFLTRQAVSLLGNDIRYDIKKIKALGYCQDTDFYTAIEKTLPTTF